MASTTDAAPVHVASVQTSKSGSLAGGASSKVVDSSVGKGTTAEGNKQEDGGKDVNSVEGARKEQWEKSLTGAMIAETKEASPKLSATEKSAQDFKGNALEKQTPQLSAAGEPVTDFRGDASSAKVKTEGDTSKKEVGKVLLNKSGKRNWQRGARLLITHLRLLRSRGVN